MLTLVDGSRGAPSYPVPWRVDRSAPSHPVVMNAGFEPLDAVRAFVCDDRSPPATERWGRILPGESVELCLCDRDPASVLVSIAWFRDGGAEEYLWRFAV